MRSETINRGTTDILSRLSYFSLLLLSGLSLNAQDKGTVAPFPRVAGIPRAVTGNLNSQSVSPAVGQREKLLPFVWYEDGITAVFLDSLKIRASRNLVTKKLYDLMVTPGRQVLPAREITGSSDMSYLRYHGLRIRKIEVQRLNVFGTSINNPSWYEPRKLEKLLNKTHVNTNESIIRKNLLFSTGDTISPLILSDNERFLRQLPYIDDARIIVVPVSETEADILVLTKDVYSLGARLSFSGFEKGSVTVFDRNIFGMGHEFGIEVPYNSRLSGYPGFAATYRINNLLKTFANLDVNYYDGLGKKTYGVNITRNFMSSASKYAGGISVRQMYTSSTLDSMISPSPLKYNFQDYWILRSFLIDRESVSRFIIGARYTNNNVFDRPSILPDSFHSLQRYKMFLGSISFSMQKFYKTSLIYGYGRTEDIPHGVLLNLTAGREINEFKKRTYVGASLSAGESVKNLGYLSGTAGLSTFFNQVRTEQGILFLRANYVSNLSFIGNYRMRNFVNIDYTRGFDRYTDEYLSFNHDNGFSGFSNDSLRGIQRISIGVESVLFSPVNLYGFKFASFIFGDLGVLVRHNQEFAFGEYQPAIGFGLRIRNDNLVFNTLQIRFAFYPNHSPYSSINSVIVSGEQLLRPRQFEPGPPSLLPFR
jgi:hypothetical protein